MALGIQKKLAATCSGFLIIAFALIMAGALSYASRLTKESIQKQQYATTELLARSLDDKLGSILVEISRVAQAVPPEVLDAPVKAQEFLRKQNTFFSVFDGIFLVNNDFNLMAVSPEDPNLLGRKVVTLRPFLVRVREFGLPDFSEPYLSPKSNGPALAVAYPLEDKLGSPKGFLVGRINLSKDNFVEDLISYRIGAKGYIYVINQERRLILHPDKSRLMKTDVPPGSNRFLEKALRGHEGSGETVNSRGVQQIISVKRLKTVNWILATVFPKEEAYSPLKSLRTFLVASFILVTALSVVIIWLLTVKITANLHSFTEQIREIKKDALRPQAVEIRGDDEVALLATTFNDLLGELDQARASLDEMTRTDPLTGLYNRRHFMQQAPQILALAARKGGTTALLMIDLDHFKRINDSYGHEVGDRVLVEVAAILRQTVRQYDLVIRHGGEEFLLLLPLAGIDEAGEVAERMRQRVEAFKMPCCHDTITFTISIGGYVARRMDDLNRSIARADRALYQAKNSGRNKACLICEE
jgi:diguanylate cyclase (GGDEF)-like protein